MPEVLVSHTLTGQDVAHLVRAVVSENYNGEDDSHDGTANTDELFSDPQPSDADFIAVAISQGAIPATRDERVVTARQGNDPGDGPRWAADIHSWNWAARQRDISLEIPLAALPDPYTPEDIIAWGKANGHLLP